MYDSSLGATQSTRAAHCFAFEYQAGIYHQTAAAQSLDRGRGLGLWVAGARERAAGVFALDDGVARGPRFCRLGLQATGSCAERDCYK